MKKEDVMIGKITVAVGLTTILGGIQEVHSHNQKNEGIVLNHQYRGIRLSTPHEIQENRKIKKRKSWMLKMERKKLAAVRRKEKKKLEIIRRTKKKKLEAERRAERRKLRIARREEQNKLRAAKRIEREILRYQRKFGHIASLPLERIVLKVPAQRFRMPPFLGKDKIVNIEPIVKQYVPVIKRKDPDEVENNSLVWVQKEVFKEEKSFPEVFTSVHKQNDEVISKIESVLPVSSSDHSQGELSENSEIPSLLNAPYMDRADIQERIFSSHEAVSEEWNGSLQSEIDEALDAEVVEAMPLSILQETYFDSELLETRFENIKTFMNDINLAIEQLLVASGKLLTYFSPISDAEELKEQTGRVEDLISQFEVIHRTFASLESDLEGADQEDLGPYHNEIMDINNLLDEGNINLATLKSRYEWIVHRNTHVTFKPQGIKSNSQDSDVVTINSPNINESPSILNSVSDVLTHIWNIIEDSDPQLNQEDVVSPPSEGQILSEIVLNPHGTDSPLGNIDVGLFEEEDEIAPVRSIPPVFQSIKPWLRHTTEEQKVVPKESFAQIINLLNPVINKLGEKLDVLNIDTLMQSKKIKEPIKKIKTWANDLQKFLSTIEKKFVSSSSYSLKQTSDEDNLDLKSTIETLKSNMEIASTFSLDDSKVGVSQFHDNIFFLTNAARYLSEECCELINTLEKKGKKPKYQVIVSTSTLTRQPSIGEILSFIQSENNPPVEGLLQNTASLQSGENSENDGGMKEKQD